jgi:hypothetical protein
VPLLAATRKVLRSGIGRGVFASTISGAARRLVAQSAYLRRSGSSVLLALAVVLLFLLGRLSVGRKGVGIARSCQQSFIFQCDTDKGGVGKTCGKREIMER